MAVQSIEPAMDRVLVEHRVGNLEPELPAEEGAASASVHHHPHAKTYLAASHREGDPRMCVSHVRTLDAYALVDGGAPGFCVLEEKQVKLASVDVIGVILLDVGLISLAERDFCRP